LIQLDFDGPVIVRFEPAQDGLDNAGIGYTRFGERYLMKVDHEVCLAEFIGAALCKACGIPHCEPTVVSLRKRPVFGSRFEHGLVRLTSDDAYGQFFQNCTNIHAMTAVLCIDLAIGNYDRHWRNWLYQSAHDGQLIRAVDFSRAWPTVTPPLTPSDMRGQNTQIAFRDWQGLGIAFDLTIAQSVCTTLRGLSQDWLHNLLEPLPVEWKVTSDAPALCAWWAANWHRHLTAVMDFLSNGAWK
jgi:hypothetical protein